MEYIRVTNENIDKEHICCAISNNNDIQVSSKKAWLQERFNEGLVFLKSEERGKCFIEYIPAENAWNPIIADGYMYINCLWVAGSFKGHGYSTDLLNACIEDSKTKGKQGITWEERFLNRDGTKPDYMELLKIQSAKSRDDRPMNAADAHKKMAKMFS